jgi:hypothetical protein
MQGYATTKEIKTPIDTFELYEGERKKVLIPEMEMGDWIYLVEAKFGLVEEMIESDTVGGGKTVYVCPSYHKALAMSAEYAGYIYPTTNEGEKFVIESSNPGAGAEHGFCRGAVPHHIVPLFLHDMQNPKEWFVPKTDVKLKLKIAAKSDSSSSYTTAILMEQNRPY